MECLLFSDLGIFRYIYIYIYIYIYPHGVPSFLGFGNLFAIYIYIYSEKPRPWIFHLLQWVSISVPEDLYIYSDDKRRVSDNLYISTQD